MSQSAGDGILAGVGLGVTALTVVAIAAPVRDGITTPTVIAALAFALVAFGVFAGRRYGRLERRLALVGAGASLAVVLLSGYALTQGITGATTVPGLDSSISAVLFGFLAAGLSTALAVGDYRAVTPRQLLGQVGLTGRLTVVALVAWVLASFVALSFLQGFTGLVGEPDITQENAVSQLGFALATAGVAVGYVFARGDDRSFFDITWPSRRALGWIIGGLLFLFAANVAISALFSATNVEVAQHTSTQEAAANPELVLVMIPASILIVGPLEELLYRNVVQKSLYDVFSPLSAIAVSSVIFAVVHAPAAATRGIEATLPFLGFIFALSMILGFCYWKTNNLVVPAVIHGCYNAIVYIEVLL